MAEDPPSPPPPDAAARRAYCQRCGDTLPPFPALRAMRRPAGRTSRAEEPRECPGCGEPTGA